MLSPFTEDLVAHLQTLGLGVYDPDGPNGTLFRDEMPAAPDVVAVVYQTGGMSPEKGFGSKAIRYEHPTASVKFRGAPGDVTGPRDRAQVAYEAFAQMEVEDVNGVPYLQMQPMQMPFPVETDAQNRRIWGFNVLGFLERVEG